MWLTWKRILGGWTPAVRDLRRWWNQIASLIKEGAELVHSEPGCNGRLFRHRPLPASIREEERHAVQRTGRDRM